MANQTLTRCVWLVDTIRRYGRITRRQLEQAWERSAYSDGKPLSRRTFCNHRDLAESLFNINIVCDPSNFEYYIENPGENRGSVSEWLLDSMSLNDVLVNARDITDRIFVENIPSAREHLSTVIDALKSHQRLRFDYHPYTRSIPTRGIEIEPYFIKLFKQRWYMVGNVVDEGKVKTYALDRIKNASVTADTFVENPDFDISGYFRYSYGIVVTHNAPRKVVLRTTPKQAKYLRALPLHESQNETVSDRFSLFTYNMRITEDFVAEILSHGSSITVLEPAELRAMVVNSLRESLKNYSEKNS